MRKNRQLIKVSTTCILLGFTPYSYAGITHPDSRETVIDTSKVVDIEEVVIVASPKEHKAFRYQPVSATVFGRKDMERRKVQSIKDFSALAPNFYMPDYGSRISNAMYMRGVGSRINTPSVGLYVDNIPYTDKSAYDFSMLDVDRIDILRGPQGTLYGRGAMSGLLRVFTTDPTYQKGVKIRLGMSSVNIGRYGNVTTYLHPSERVHLSLGAFYEGENGFFRNAYTHKKADASESGGGRMRMVWRPKDNWKVDMTLSMEQSHENSNPYFYLGAVGEPEEYAHWINHISQNRQSNYRRRLLNAGVSVAYNKQRFTATSITAFQYFDDRLFMDQDFLNSDIFSLSQQQRFKNISEELSFKGNIGDHINWTAGAFMAYDYKHTNCPVNFYEDGTTFLNNMFRRVVPSFIQIRFTDTQLPFEAHLKAPGWNAALYSQFTKNNFLLDRLSATIGLRFDYDAHRLDLDSPAKDYHYFFGINYPSSAYQLNIHKDFVTGAPLAGHHQSFAFEVLPKVALKYDLGNGRGNIFFSVTKGYRSGGYNMENYSELSQNVLRRSIMQQVKAYSIETINQLTVLDDYAKQKAIAGMTAVVDHNMPAQPEVKDLRYKPEYTWSHELGMHLNLFDHSVELDGALFYQKTSDLQIARFAPNGLGREIKNSGSSTVLGAELSAKASMLSDRLSLMATYGYAHSIFKHYDVGFSREKGENIHYDGNRVPYVPQHTLALDALYRQPLQHSFFKAVSVGGNLKGAGSIVWDEANLFRSPFYLTCGIDCGVELGNHVQVSVKADNLTKTRYKTFSFVSMKHRFAQYGPPFHLSMDVIIRL